MTMTGMERERLTSLSEGQASIMKDAEHMKDTMNRIHKRLDDMHDYLKKVTEDVAGILRQNEMHEERLAQLQNITASLGETVVQLEKSGKRLKHVSFAFWAILLIMSVLVGVLGEEILPKAFKWLWALMGI